MSVFTDSPAGIVRKAPSSRPEVVSRRRIPAKSTLESVQRISPTKFLLEILGRERLTALEDLDLLDWSLVEDGTSLEDLERVRTSVSDGSLQASVANRLQLDIKRRVSLDGGGGCQGGKRGEATEELHLKDRESVCLRATRLRE